MNGPAGCEWPEEQKEEGDTGHTLKLVRASLRRKNEIIAGLEAALAALREERREQPPGGLEELVCARLRAVDSEEMAVALQEYFAWLRLPACYVVVSTGEELCGAFRTRDSARRWRIKELQKWRRWRKEMAEKERQKRDDFHAALRRGADWRSLDMGYPERYEGPDAYVERLSSWTIHEMTLLP